MRALPNRVHVRQYESGAGHSVECDGCGRRAWLVWVQRSEVLRIASRHAYGCADLWSANHRDARRCWACEGRSLPRTMGPCLVCDGKGWLPREDREVAR